MLLLSLLIVLVVVVFVVAVVVFSVFACCCCWLLLFGVVAAAVAVVSVVFRCCCCYHSCGFIALLTFGICCRSVSRFICNPLQLTAPHHKPIPTSYSTHQLPRIHFFNDLRHLLSVGFAIFLPPKATATALADTINLLYWAYYSTLLGIPAYSRP